ncbi:MAG: MaoC/PaaZ C-terminal domain-containing protein [Dehalococcoidia bacterium]
MADQIYFEDINEGDTIPEVVKSPTTQQLVQWAAGSGDFYQIHYDKDFAIGTGLDGVIVHGALKHAWLGDLLHRFVAPGGRVKRVTCSYRGMDIPGKKFALRGKVAKKYSEGTKHYVELEIWGESEDGQKTTPGSGIVTLPSRS